MKYPSSTFLSQLLTRLQNITLECDATLRKWKHFILRMHVGGRNCLERSWRRTISCIFSRIWSEESWSPLCTVWIVEWAKKFVVYIPDWQLLHICPHLTWNRTGEVNFDYLLDTLELERDSSGCLCTSVNGPAKNLSPHSKRPFNKMSLSKTCLPLTDWRL